MYSSRARGVLSLVLAAFLEGSSTAQQPAPTPARQGQVVTKVDVDILELDVLALDGKDRPVPDLTKDDFEVRIAGKLQPLEFFDPPAPPRTPGTGAPAVEVLAGTASPARPDARPVHHVLFFIDLEMLPLGAINETAPALRSAVGRVPAPARFSVVSHFGRSSSLAWEEEVLDRVTGVLDSMAATAAEEARDGMVTFRPGGSYPGRQDVDNPRNYEQRQSVERLLLDDLVQAIDTYRTTRDARPMADAWRRIGQYVMGERIRVRDMVQGLHGICEEFARLEGRKTLVLVSRGFERAPGFNLLNAAEVAAKGAMQGNTAQNIQPNAPFPGLPGEGAGGFSASPLPDVDDLVKWIAASGITLHFLDPSRATDMKTAEQGRGERYRPLSGERMNLEDQGSNLARVTGGMARFQPGDLAPALGVFLDASSGAYRLGVRMTDVDPRRSYRVDVAVKRKGVHVLARSAYQPKLPGGAAASDVAQADRQRLRAGVDERRPGAARQVLTPIAVSITFRGKSPVPPIERKNLYKLDVLIPYDDLKFLPEEDAMVASTRISVVADSTEGKGRESFAEDLFLSLTGKEYSAASGTQATKTLTLTLVPGKWSLSVSVSDLLENRTGLARATITAEP